MIHTQFIRIGGIKIKLPIYNNWKEITNCLYIKIQMSLDEVCNRFNLNI